MSHFVLDPVRGIEESKGAWMDDSPGGQVFSQNTKWISTLIVYHDMVEQATRTKDFAEEVKFTGQSFQHYQPCLTISWTFH